MNPNSENPKVTRFWIALDVADQNLAEQWMARFPHHKHYKVGMELFYRTGPDVIKKWIEEDGLSIFLDLKLHDIPRTVAAAVSQLDALGVSLTTIHLMGGRAMCEAAVQARTHLSLVGVSVLTSLGNDDLTMIGISSNVSDQVKRLAAMGRDTGLDGIVLSGQELTVLSPWWPEARFVVPGIRRASDASNDQKRIITPEQAVKHGATDLVIGRTLLKAEDPMAAYQELTKLVQGGRNS
ncbi:orotidine-5'-phosphate decarboxylase [Sulfobacillus thermosulfidooxidans DSM 9293]|uniref:Orotidine 5'-phosphate decarboxylase n=1 Tax=Sulfobacillus thermosulfidooxidans (strain DSM 9293 / VKM B-1269 / AT-1) TaxID=929705 RepID=A0A1W1WN13_SULTA|nr:orotidine-5'-phosphate decarboxylase [Sulfobacillus thermosulfidooxidans]SMC07615.1 orotidine-5'-phosphate decarboxylase [Sulfobacillus thermosulfidooxidans DSM 9293]